MRLYYVHDPMCSWCWAFRPVLLTLLADLPSEIKFIRLLGGLAADSNEPMLLTTRNYIIENWQAIEQQVPSTRFNYEFWHKCQPKRSTYPACRAVIAARQQDPSFDSIMTLAIQKAYYLEARNPSEINTLIELAEETGLDVNRFSDDLNSMATITILLDEIKTARSLKMNSFPGLLLATKETSLPIAPDYHTATTILQKIMQAMP